MAKKETVKAELKKKITVDPCKSLKTEVELLNSRLVLLNLRVTTIVNALDKSKSVRGL